MTLAAAIQASLERLVADVASDPAVQGLDVYVVGGAVRDALLDLPAGDRDWVVVGAEPQDMARRGFTPVGGDFPVFLHPVTHEEYALARTERKTGRGYKGFVFHAGPDVSLADDLQRRDLTVNAIALDLAGKLHDPCGGRQDLQARVLRHIGQAFAEDPVRILRLGRFASRFVDFVVAEETLQLCRQMVSEGEADALVPERVWREISRTLAETRPARMFEILAEVGALARIAPEWDQVWGQLSEDAAGRSLQHWLQQLSRAESQLQAISPEPTSPAAPTLPATSVQALSLAERYALLCLPIADAAALHTRLKVPVECADMARLLAMWRDAVASNAVTGGASVPEPEALLERVERCDGLRKPARFEALVQLAALAWPEQVDSTLWLAALQTILAVDAGAVARTAGKSGPAIREAVRQARLAALTERRRNSP